TDEGADDQRENHRFPPQEGANGAHELDVAQAHRLARQNDFTADSLQVRDLFRVELLFADLQPARGQTNANILVTTVHQLHSPRLYRNRVRRAIKHLFIGNLAVGQL